RCPMVIFALLFVMSSLSSSLCDTILVQAKFQSVYHMVMDEDFPACTRLLSCTHSLASLHHVAEEKGQRSLFSPHKLMMTVNALGKTNISVGERVKSMTYVRDYLQYARGLISADISEDLRKALLKHLQLPELSSTKKVEHHSKLSDKSVEAGEDYTKFNSSDFARKKMSAAQKILAKVDKTGMKSMSAFFSTKGKAEKLNVRMVHQNLYVYVGVRGYTECTKH
uniref:Uncharacterized protein n=1 Tax=Oncorhynchus tshawytscha TaxID=74940 RepID=A0A8C8EUD9_ONCTS